MRAIASSLYRVVVDPEFLSKIVSRETVRSPGTVPHIRMHPGSI